MSWGYTIVVSLDCKPFHAEGYDTYPKNSPSARNFIGVPFASAFSNGTLETKHPFNPDFKLHRMRKHGPVPPPDLHGILTDVTVPGILQAEEDNDNGQSNTSVHSG